MKRLTLFWELLIANQSVPAESFKKLFRFALGVSILFSLAYVRPAALFILVIALSPYLVIFAMAFIMCLLIIVIWFWWQEAGRLIEKGVDNPMKSGNIDPSTPLVSIMERQYLNAVSLARMKHAGQVDQAGNDYFSGHLLRVTAQFTNKTRKAVAILHDIIEDTPMSAENLRKLDVSEEIITAVEIVTRREGEKYHVFIDRIANSDNQHAIAIKLADLKDHLVDTSAISDSLVKRYIMAIDILSQS